ncbi:MAG: flagellar basal body L-ring protein FlgH [Candidatus Methylomirabilis sp.]|nr:flagellar basal body L-ring protein FlgH [Deltaproteobacteria bacterium]
MPRTAARLLLGALAALLLSQSGCSRLAWDAHRRVEEDLQGLDKPNEYLPAPDSDPHYLQDGSLWQAGNSQSLLFTDSKARQVNDLVTVLIRESSKATKKATTDATRETELEAGLTNFFGVTEEVGVEHSFIDPTSLIKGSASSSFKGSGATTRDEQLAATMTAVVQEVLPNGNLVVKGRRIVTVNDEEQYMILTGTIRTEDIRPDNTIESALIADARITYSGVGSVSDKQSPGWGQQVFDWIWPL